VVGGRVRRWELLIPGVAAPVAADHLLAGRVGQAVLVGGYALLGLFLWANRLLVGVGIVAVGLAANAAVVVADGGMPVRSSAVVAAGLAGPDGPAAPPAGSRHHLEGSGDDLVALDDHLALRPLHRVVSYGDVIMTVGALDVIAHLGWDVWAGRRRRESYGRPREGRRYWVPAAAAGG
jgi:hypothetical protein